MARGKCWAAVVWVATFGLASIAAAATQAPEADSTDPPTTVQPDQEEEEEGSNRFLSHSGSAFGAFGVASAIGSSSLSAYQGFPSPQHLPQGGYHQPPHLPLTPGHAGYPGGHHNVIPQHSIFPQRPSQGCKYFCPWSTHNVPYCCDKSPSLTGYLCPPVRYECPHSDRHLHTPTYCSQHQNCPLGERCCFDACAQAHVCKTPL